MLLQSVFSWRGSLPSSFSVLVMMSALVLHPRMDYWTVTFLTDILPVWLVWVCRVWIPIALEVAACPDSLGPYPPPW